MVEVIQILIAKYPNVAAAESALKKLQNARDTQGIALYDAAVVWRTHDDKLHIHETVDVTGGRGAAVGGILGGVLGIIAGPAGVVAGAAVGAAVGGAAAKVFDSGIPKERLETIGAELEMERAALVLLTEAGYVEFLKDLIGGADVEILAEAMNAVAANEMGREYDVAVRALKMGDALAEGGMASPVEKE